MSEKPTFGTLAAIDVNFPNSQLVKLSAALVVAGLILILSYSIIKKL